ncbi:MAG: GTP cyclohydrolase [Pyrinomonadaceae bacterium]
MRLAERDLKTRFGIFNEILYYDGQRESIALVMGNVRDGDDVLCRIHSACIGGHVFNSVECQCAAEMESAQKAIQETGRGVIIYLDQEGKGNGHLALMLSIPFKEMGHSQSEAYEMAGYSADSRSYRGAADILKELEISSVVLLSENQTKAQEFRRFGVNISDQLPLRIEL